jgi:hypothetical protein
MRIKYAASWLQAAQLALALQHAAILDSTMFCSCRTLKQQHATAVLVF